MKKSFLVVRTPKESKILLSFYYDKEKYLYDQKQNIFYYDKIGMPRVSNLALLKNLRVRV